MHAGGRQPQNLLMTCLMNPVETCMEMKTVALSWRACTCAQVLEDMAIFQSLSPANRSSIADCLTTETYQVCQSIIVLQLWKVS